MGLRVPVAARAAFAELLSLSSLRRQLTRCGRALPSIRDPMVQALYLHWAMILNPLDMARVGPPALTLEYPGPQRQSAVKAPVAAAGE